MRRLWRFGKTFGKFKVSSSRGRRSRLLEMFIILIYVEFFMLAVSPFAAYASGGVNLAELVRQTLVNSVDIKLAVLDYKIALAEAQAGAVDFDPLLTFSPEYRSERQLSNSTLESQSYLETTGSLSFGVKKKFPIGTSAEAVFQEMWLTSDSIQTTYGDRDQAAFQIKLTQPLLKGLGRDANEATLRKSNLKAERYKTELEGTLNDSIVKVGTLYFDVAQAKIQERIKEANVSFYSEKRDEAISRAANGSISKADALAIEAQFQVTLAEASLARSNTIEAQEKLAREIENTPSLEIPNETELLSLVLPEPAIMNFKTMHPSLLALRSQAHETQIDLAKSRNALMPQLDFTIQGSTVGVGKNHNTAEEGLTSRRTPSWQAGLVFSWSFENHLAKSENSRLIAELQTREYTINRQELELTKQRASVVRDILTAGDALRTAKKRAAQAETLLQAKESQFDAGRISAPDLIQARQDLINVRAEAVKAAVRLRKGALRLAGLDQTILSREEQKAFFEAITHSAH